jgi:uncharacterized protein (TIGR02145 family)
MNYVVKNGEQISDVILNSSGSLDNWSLILEANNFDTWTPDLLPGQIIIIPDNIILQPNVKAELDQYPANNNSAAADILDQIYAITHKVIPNQLLDLDGNFYNTIKIGNYEIIVQNFQCTKYADGTAIPELTEDADWSSDTEGAQCKYNNDVANKSVYGLLYNWFAVNNARGLCYFERNGTKEDGWEITNNDFWNDLLNLLGGDYTVVGGKLKETGTVHWQSPNVGATDEIGFKALPGGSRVGYGGTFANINQAIYLWCSDSIDDGNAADVAMGYTDGVFSSVFTNNMSNSKATGQSVRCFRKINTDEEMKYQQTINLVADVTFTATTTVPTEPYNVFLLDADGNDITASVDISLALIGGVYVIYITSTTAYSGVNLKIIY